MVSGAVYDAAGNRVADLGSALRSSGRQQVTWNSTAARPGVYVVKLTAGNDAAALRLVKAD